MKMTCSVHLSAFLFLFVALNIGPAYTQGSCSQTFNATEGTATTLGFPNRLDFNRSCIFEFSGARFKLTFENVSLPNDSYISLIDANSVPFKVDGLQSKVWYTTHIQRSTLLLILPVNFTNFDAFSGLKIHYEKLSSDACQYTFVATSEERFEWLRSSGTQVNVTCEYYVEAESDERVIQLKFEQLRFPAGDEITFYEGESNDVIDMYNTTTFVKSPRSRSKSMRIKYRFGNAYGARRFYFTFMAVRPDNSCDRQYYGTNGKLQSPGKDCNYTLSFPFGVKTQLEFSNLTIPQGNYIAISQGSGSNNRTTYLDKDTVTETYIFVHWEKCVIEFTSVVKFDITIKPYATYECPYSFHTQADFQSNTDWSTGNPFNVSCEFFIENVSPNLDIVIAASDLSLAPQDNLTFYEDRGNKVLANYDGSSELKKFNALNSESVRVVFTPGPSSVGRDIRFMYRNIAQGSCVKQYFGESGTIPAPGKDCLIMIRKPSVWRTELKFENLIILPNDTITIAQKSTDRYNWVTKRTHLSAQDSDPVKYFISSTNAGTFLEINVNSSAKFNLKFQPFITTSATNLQGTNGTILSPYYPFSYPYRHNFIRRYHITVPSGHVLLNFTEMMLAPDKLQTWGIPDMMRIYDGPNDNAQLLAIYTNGTIKDDLPVVLASTNNLTLEFQSWPSSLLTEDTYRFRAVFNEIIDVNYCTSLDWAPHSYPSRNKTLPGRKTVFKCKDGYVRKEDPRGVRGVERLCGFDGNWAPGDELVCVPTCPHIDASLKNNGTLSWSPSWTFYPLYSGKNVTFFCSYGYDMIGPNTITCTSHGNFTSAPPYCKKRPDKDGDSSSGVKPWVYGAGAAGAGFIITIVLAVLRVCFGCFACCDTMHRGSTSIELTAQK